MANPTQQEVAQAVYDLTAAWKPDGATTTQSWWPPVSEKPAVDVVHALRVQAERLDAAGQMWFPYETYYGGHDNSRWEWDDLTWTKPFLIDPATGQPSHAYAVSVLNGNLETLREEMWKADDAPRPTREDVIRVRATYCNQTDSRGQVIYGPSYPAAIKLGWSDEWFEKERAQGNTHIILGPFDPGKAYPEHFPGEFPNEPENPDSRDPQVLRTLVLKILNTPSATGRGFVPILFLDGGGANPKPRIDAWWQKWGHALADLQPYIIIVPGWEPVGPGGAWTTTEMSYALEKARESFPTARIYVHTPPDRGSFASWPPETDPIWHGQEAECWMTHGGQHASGHLYQTQHAPDVYEPLTCQCALWPQKWGHQDSEERCAGNRCEDSVARSGAGHNGWRVLEGGVVLMETTAFEEYQKFKNLDFKNYVSPTAEHVRALMRERVYAKWGVKFYYGQ